MTVTSHAFFLKPQVSVIPLAGEVLYETEHSDLNAFAKDFTADWGLPVLLNILDESTVFESEGSLVMMESGANPADREDVAWAAETAQGWDAVSALQRAKSTIRVIIVPKTATQKAAASTLVKVLSTLTLRPGTLAVAGAHTLIEPTKYRNASSVLGRGELPLSNLVYLGLYENDGETGAYTAGLDQFGHPEIEILGSARKPEAVYQFLENLVQYVIDTGSKLRDGDELQISPTESVGIKFSKGVALPSVKTVKISY